MNGDAAVEAARLALWTAIDQYATAIDRHELPDDAIKAINSAIAAHTEAAVKGREAAKQEIIARLADQNQILQSEFDDLTARLAEREKIIRGWNTPRPGEPFWHHAIRVIDGKAIDVLEGVIGKVEYDALKQDLIETRAREADTWERVKRLEHDWSKKSC